MTQERPNNKSPKRLILQNEFTLVDVLSSKEMLARQIRAAEPDILLVDSQLGSESTMDIIDDLALQFPTAAVVAILPTMIHWLPNR